MEPKVAETKPAQRIDASQVQRAPEALAAWFRTRLAESSSLRWQSDLARKAHVSQTVVSDLFRAVRPIPEDKIRALAAALGADDAELVTVHQLWSTAKIAWAKKQLAEGRGAALHTTHEGLPTPSPLLRHLLGAQRRARDDLPYRLLTERIPPLSILYVRQNIQHAATTRTPHGVAEAGSQTPRSTRSQPLNSALASHRHLVVTAAAGGGKSTLLYQLAAEAAQWWLRETAAEDTDPDDSPSGMTVPVRVPAQALIGKPLADAIAASVLDDLAEYLDLPTPSPEMFAQPPMPNVHWLVMVDGLDEILDSPSRAKVINSISSRSVEQRGPFRFLIVSRPLPQGGIRYFDPEIFDHYTLEEFDDDQLENYARAWFEARSPDTANSRVEHFLNLIKHHNLQPIAALPLLATIALLVFEQTDPEGPTLPAGRAGLYAEFLNYLLNVRQETAQTRIALQRQLSPFAYGLKIAEWTHDNLVQLLEDVATRYLHGDRQPLAQLATDWVEHTCPYSTEAIPDWPQKLSQVLLSAGLIIRQSSGLEFLHRSFAEYLAAGPIARRLPDIFSRASARTLARSNLLLSNRSRSLFALGRWRNSRKGRNLNYFIQELLVSGPDHILFAADVITFEARVESDLEGQIADSLSLLARATIDEWHGPLSTLAALPNREIARTRLSALAQNAAHLAVMRIRAARLVGDLGDRRSSVEILTLMGNANPHPSVFVEDDIEKFILPKRTENFMRRLQLGEVESQDYGNYAPWTVIRPIGYFTGTEDVGEAENDAALEDIFLPDSIDPAAELDDDLQIRAMAAWELADIGEISTAVSLLVKVALEEYRVSIDIFSSMSYVPLPSEFSYWTINVDELLARPILVRIAGKRTIHPAVRLTAAFALADRSTRVKFALKCIKAIAAHDEHDVLVRLQAAIALEYLGERRLAESLLRAIAADSVIEMRIRLQACEELGRIVGRNAVVETLSKISSNIDEHPANRVLAAEAIYNHGELDGALRSLAGIALDRDEDIEVRFYACRHIEEIVGYDFSLRILRSIANSLEEAPETRIAAARELVLGGDVDTGASVLIGIASDASIDFKTQSMALEELREIALG